MNPPAVKEHAAFGGVCASGYPAGSMAEARTVSRWQVAGVILVAMLVYLIGNGSVSLWDRDEPRYAQTSRQMLKSGDWVVPRLLDEVRTAKPVFIYWCQASAMAVLGDTDYAARLPSVIGMVLTLILLAIICWRTLGPPMALMTILVLSSAGLSIGAAKMCLTDAVLLLFITGAQLTLYRAWYFGLTWRVTLAMGIAIGMASLTKGPVVLGVMLMTLIALGIFRIVDQPKPRLRHALMVGKEFWKWIPARAWFELLTAIFIAVLINLPWLILVNQREPSFLSTTIGHDVVGRITTPLEGHKGPPGYYLLTIWVTFFPWSLLLPATLFFAWRNREQNHIRFALAAVLGPWLMFELVQTKLPHYLLPVFPALAILTAEMLKSRNTPLRRPVWIAVGMLAGVAIVYGLVLPRISQIRISDQVAKVLLDQGATHPGDAIMIDYKEMSLAFYQGGTIRPQRNNQFLQITPPADWPKWIVLTGDIWKNTPDEIKQQLEIVGNVHGLSYADGMRNVDVMVLRKR